jgi:nucleoside-diphosphate-sugar epimerase
MKVLVTGSEGYIGTVLVPMLLERGYDVIGLDTGYLANRRFVPGIRRHRLIHKDIRDVERTDVGDVEAVIHLAALSNDPMGELNPELTVDINHRASVRLAELSREAGVRRFLFSSSCSIYGAGAGGALDEQATFNPLTAYAKSKVATEADLRPLASDDFSPVYLRNATAAGVSPRMRFDLVVSNLTAWGFTTGKVTLLSDGSAWRPLVHIRDIALAMLACLEAPREVVHDQAFNVGRNDGNYQIRDVAEQVARVVPNAEVSFAPKAEADKRNYNVSFAKIHRVLGQWFKPTWTLQDMIEECYEACRIGRLTYDEFDSPMYITIKRLKQLIEAQKLDASLRWRDGAESSARSR